MDWRKTTKQRETDYWTSLSHDIGRREINYDLNEAVIEATKEIAERTDDIEDIARKIVRKPGLVRDLCAKGGVPTLGFEDVVSIVRDDRAIDEANELVDGPQAEAFARALDVLGWMIVEQPNPNGVFSGNRWPLDPKYGN